MTKRRRPGSPNVAIGYLRASTGRQELSPDAQRSQIEGWAHREGVAVVAWFTDAGVSGGDAVEERPGLLAALDALGARGAGLLVVKDRTRVARDMAVALQVEASVAAKGARVASIDGAGNGDGPIDVFVRRQVDAASELQRAMIKANTRAALAVKKRRGELTGKAPYGQRVGADGIHLEAEPAEQATIAKVCELRAAGMPYRTLVEELDALGLHNRKGRPFGVREVYLMATRATAA